MAQVIDSGNLIRLKGYFPLIGAVTLFGIGLFVLSRNRKAAVNQLFAAGILALAVADAAWFASVHSSSASILLLWQRIILATHIVMLPAWYLYTACFGSADFREGIRRQRFLAWGIGVMSLLFLCLVPTDYVIQGVLAPAAWRLGVDKTVRPRSVEPQHPITDRLQTDTAKPRRIAT